MQAIVCVLIVLSFIQTAFLALSWYLVRSIVDDTTNKVKEDVKRLVDSQRTTTQTDLELVELKKQFDSLKSALALKSAFVK